MSKMKIEIRKPQYLSTKESDADVKKEARREVRKEKAPGPKTPFFFRLLVFATYVLSGLAIWYVFQKYNAHS